MKSLRIAVVVFAALVAASWWAVMPPRDVIVISAPRATGEPLPCPPGGRVEGKLCVCPDGAASTGGACMAKPAATGHGNRHVTTVDLRRQRTD